LHIKEKKECLHCNVCTYVLKRRYSTSKRFT
jgi:hypothetical protein